MDDGLKELLVADGGAWRRWLEREHGRSPGVWLILHKKGGGVTRLTYADALAESLCFGWIDGQLRTRDGGSYFQRFTPRRPRSNWSARNVQHVARLEGEGRMHAAGRAAVERARADGRWSRACASASSAKVPEDLVKALRRGEPHRPQAPKRPAARKGPRGSKGAKPGGARAGRP